MNNNDSNSKLIKIASIFGIIFVAYNVILFVLTGFEDHEGAYWSSYIFMLLSFVVVIASSFLLRDKPSMHKNWFLGFPILKQCAIYFIVEFFVSTLFIILDYEDCPWAIAFAIQFLILTVFLVLIIMAFLAKEVVNTVNVNTKIKTYRMKTFQLDAESLATNATSMELKMAFAKLAEDFRFSDPVSSDALKDVEEQIAYSLNQAKSAVSINDVQGAIFYCDKASSLLKDRNRICKMFK